MKTLIILSAILIVALSQAPPVASPPKPCYIYPAFTASVFQYFVNPSGVEVNTGIIYINYPAQVVRFDITAGAETFGGNQVNYAVSIFEDFNKQEGWVFDQQSKTCSSFPLTVPLGGGEIPSDALFLAELLIGSQPIHEYLFGTADYKFEVGLTTGSCLLYNVDIYNTTTAGEATLTGSEAFWNVAPSVSPFIFEVPSACTTTNNLTLAHLGSEARKRKVLAAIEMLNLHHLAFSSY